MFGFATILNICTSLCPILPGKALCLPCGKQIQLAEEKLQHRHCGCFTLSLWYPVLKSRCIHNSRSQSIKKKMYKQLSSIVYVCMHRDILYLLCWVWMFNMLKILLLHSSRNREDWSFICHMFMPWYSLY